MFRFAKWLIFVALFSGVGFVSTLYGSEPVLIGSERVTVEESCVALCADAGAGGYEAFPDVTRLVDGRLFCAFYAGYTHVSFPNESLPQGGRIVGCYSSDEGRTWTEPRVVVDTPLDDRDPSLLQSPDGRLICNFFTHSPGNRHRDSYLVESSDGGETWSAPRLLFANFPCSSPIRILSTGRWILGFYEGAGHTYAAVSWSDDAGRTWSPLVKVPCPWPVDESDLIERLDGSLYLIQRDHMAVSGSTDGGETWSESTDAGFVGHCPYLLRLKDRPLVLLGTRVPETMLRVSRDDCQTWSEPIQIDTHHGAYPSMVELTDGTVLVVYYEEGDRSNILARRIRFETP